MTKEEKRKAKKAAYDKQWRIDNKEKVKENSRQYYLDNKEKHNKYSKEYHNKQKDGYHRVYLLEDYNYVGVTSSIYNRFNRHNRDCTNHRVLYKTKDRSEALELEALLHDMGYEGKHKQNRYV